MPLLGGPPKPAHGFRDVFRNSTSVERISGKIELRVDVPMFSSFPKPARGFFIVFRKTHCAHGVMTGQQILRERPAPFSRAPEPSQALGIVCIHSLTFETGQRQTKLRVTVTTLGGFAKPFVRSKQTSFTALSVRKHAAEKETGLRDSLACSFFRPLPGFRQIQLHRSEEHTSELQSLRHLVCRL